MSNREIDWDAIREEYVQNPVIGNLKAVAKKFGVSFETTRKRASREGWRPQQQIIASHTKEQTQVHVLNLHKVWRDKAISAAEARMNAIQEAWELLAPRWKEKGGWTIEYDKEGNILRKKFQQNVTNVPQQLLALVRAEQAVLEMVWRATGYGEPQRFSGQENGQMPRSYDDELKLRMEAIRRLREIEPPKTIDIQAEIRRAEELSKCEVIPDQAAGKA